MTTRHVVYMGLSDLKPAEDNPKNHDLPSLVASLRRYGWTEPALLDERTGRLVVGHGRREACVMLRSAGDPPPGGVYVDDDGDWLVPVLRGWASASDTEAKAYLIASNRLTTAGGWYERGLASLLEEVVTDDAPLMETLGFTADDIDSLLARFDPDDLGPDDPDAPSEPGEDPDDDTLDLDATDEEDPDPAAVTTCPNCGHQWEDQ